MEQEKHVSGTCSVILRDAAPFCGTVEVAAALLNDFKYLMADPGALELTTSASGGLARVLLSYGSGDGDAAKFGQYGLAEHGAMAARQPSSTTAKLYKVQSAHYFAARV